MCGRFGVEQEYVQIALRYRAIIDVIDPGPRYNVAPTQPVPVIAEYKAERHLAHHRWGLVPFWAKDLSIGARMINARSETLTALPAFRESFERRRCVIPASRFYEWKRDGKARLPYTICRNDGEAMSFAGLWASWRHPETKERVLSCSIVTTAANQTVAQLHDRMPLMLSDEALAQWLDPEFTNVAALQPLLVPYPDNDDLFLYPVSPLVNNPNNEGPELIVPTIAPQRSL